MKHRIAQDCVKDTSRKEKESRSGCPVDQEDRDRLTDELFHIGVV
jgi:hypothetical protein